ncbi:hypothetical protein E2C01_046361 [Portunus trituberculatus]|uniref:Uncharacterized protein n=1 Tax=Portunus trituberculatus TaxID=210409 RepID=A0A5B7FY96_PORTR|nr:hypothetical protein [Portunus trituberculatus]
MYLCPWSSSLVDEIKTLDTFASNLHPIETRALASEQEPVQSCPAVGVTHYSVPSCLKSRILVLKTGSVVSYVGGIEKTVMH